MLQRIRVRKIKNKFPVTVHFPDLVIEDDKVLAKSFSTKAGAEKASSKYGKITKYRTSPNGYPDFKITFETEETLKGFFKDILKISKVTLDFTDSNDAYVWEESGKFKIVSEDK